MSEIEKIVSSLEGTREAEIICEVDKAYQRIKSEQDDWYEKCRFFCPDGCGSCCHDFEPDLLEGEALFMAAWLIDNQKETAENIAEGKFPFENGKTCPFHNFDNPYHCLIYGGRPAICRLFGASAAKNKTGEKVWKPCKFYPAEKLAQYNPLLVHRQFNIEETEQILGAMPPVMSDLMEQIEYSGKNTETKLVREILPETVRRLLWLKQLCEAKNDI